MMPMEKKPAMLFILPYCPYPLTTGGHQAIFTALVALKDTVRMILTFEVWKDEEHTQDYAVLKEQLGDVEIRPFLKEKCYLEQKVGFGRKLYVGLWYVKEYFRKKMCGRKEVPDTYIVPSAEFLPKDAARSAFVRGLVRDYHVCIVECDMLQTAAYVYALPPTVKKVFVHHELGFVREQLTVQAKTRHPAQYQAALAAYKKKEVDLLNHFDSVLTLSSSDTKKLAEAGVSCRLSTSFATVATHPGERDVPVDPFNLVFVGPDCHYPNLAGLDWFLSHCWKRLKERNPAFRLRVFGLWEPAHVRLFRRRYADVSFPGFVEDLPAAISGSVMIVPITIGSGIRMKILEASCCGVPVVSTHVGAEGLPVRHGEHCLLSDTSDAFIESLLSLQNIALCRSLVQASRALVSAHYTIPELAVNRKAALADYLR